MTVKKTSAENQVDIVLLVGQLLEATKAAADGLKSIGSEVHRNSATIISTARKLKTVHETVQQLDLILRGSATQESLLAQLHVLRRTLEDVESDVTDFRDDIDTVRGDQAKIQDTHAKIAGGKFVLIAIGTSLAWAVTTLIAVYAALR